MYKFIDYIFE